MLQRSQACKDVQRKSSQIATICMNCIVQEIERPMKLGPCFPNILNCNPEIKRNKQKTHAQNLGCKPLYKHSAEIKLKSNTQTSYQRTLVFPILLCFSRYKILVMTFQVDLQNAVMCLEEFGKKKNKKKTLGWAKSTREHLVRLNPSTT